MPIEEIPAYRISDGRCFANKQAAYHEEVVLLLKRLPDAAKRGLTLASLDKAIADAAALLGQVDALRGSLVHEADQPLAARLNKLVEDLRKWHVRAGAVRAQIAGEADPEVKRAVEMQE